MLPSAVLLPAVPATGCQTSVTAWPAAAACMVLAVHSNLQAAAHAVQMHLASSLPANAVPVRQGQVMVLRMQETFQPGPSSLTQGWVRLQCPDCKATIVRVPDPASPSGSAISGQQLLLLQAHALISCTGCKLGSLVGMPIQQLVCLPSARQNVQYNYSTYRAACTHLCRCGA